MSIGRAGYDGQSEGEMFIRQQPCAFTLARPHAKPPAPPGPGRTAGEWCRSREREGKKRQNRKGKKVTNRPPGVAQSPACPMSCWLQIGS